MITRSHQIQSVSRSDDHCSHQIQSVSRSDDHCSHQIQSVSRSDITAVTRSSPYPDHMVDHYLETTSNGSERQWRLGHLDEPQRQISSEDLVTLTAIGKRPLEPVDHLWRFSTAWYGTVRHGSVRYGTAQFGSVCVSTPQFSTAIEWVGLFTRRYNCAASTAVTSS